MTGKEITVIISQDGTALASTRIKSSDLVNKCDTIEKASSTQHLWKEYVAGRREWDINVGYLVLEKSQIRNVLMIGQTFNLTFKAVEGASEETLTGSAILTTADVRATIGSLARGTFSFKGTGPLT